MFKTGFKDKDSVNVVNVVWERVPKTRGYSAVTLMVVTRADGIIRVTE